MRVDPNSLADQRRAFETLRGLLHDWRREAERSELGMRTSAESPLPSGKSRAIADAAMVADLEERARPFLPADEVGRRTEERELLTARTQTALDLENFGERSQSYDAWQRHDTVLLRAQHAVHRARIRLRSAAWRAWRAAGAPPEMDRFINSYMHRHTGIEL